MFESLKYVWMRLKEFNANLREYYRYLEKFSLKKYTNLSEFLPTQMKPEYVSVKPDINYFDISMQLCSKTHH